ncbi:MAG: hypothetical protein NW214_02575 [Pseudanabaenaceae cyanobacterium bins.39]|nr:hypothetical protein [Pseudanabaenaceae cyanobacterium bins.39]
MTNSSGTVGIELAQAVANKLEQGFVLAFNHRDYCGMGLQYTDGVFIYAEVQDGFLPKIDNLRGDLQNGAMTNIQYLLFYTRAEFIDWLASQSDHTLSGSEIADEFIRNNQRLTVKRLQEFVA